VNERDLADLERRVRDSIAGDLRAALNALQATVSAVYVAAAGDTRHKLPAPAQATLRAHVVGILDELSRRDYATTRQVLIGAARAGLTGGGADLGVDVERRLPADIRDALKALTAGMRDDLKAARRLARVGSLERYGDAQAILSTAKAALNRADRTAVWVVHRAHNEGRSRAVEQLWRQGTQVRILWRAERDACCIPGTRVSAPTTLRAFPDTPGLMTEDVTQGFSLGPSTLDVSLRGEVSSPAASTLTVPILDLSGLVRVSEREYLGQVFTLRTAGGKEFTGTPNHPVATGRGWLPLAQIELGDYVFSRSRTHGSDDGLNPDLDQIQPRIEDVARALQLVGTSRVVPVSAEDFHGDGAGSIDVDVVWAERPLSHDVNTPTGEHVCKQVFNRTDAKLSLLDGQGSLDLTAIAHGATDVAQTSLLDDSSTARIIQLMRAAEIAPERQACTGEPSSDSCHADAMKYGDFLAGLAVLVEPDEVIEVRSGEFRGHVYNLETREGWYLSEDILSHNCVSCLSYAGALAEPGETFRPVVQVADPSARPKHSVIGPPLHVHCRCGLEAWAGAPEADLGPLDLPYALRREAQRSILRGETQGSQPARLRAADRLADLAGLLVPKTVVKRARKAIAAGKFPA
jgi:hypothetical protein